MATVKTKHNIDTGALKKVMLVAVACSCVEREFFPTEPAYILLRVSDYAKFDIRVDKETMIPYFMDCNPNTALGPGDQPITEVMGLHGIDFPDILASLPSKHVESPERPKEI